MTEATFLAAGLDRKSNRPLFQQLYETLSAGIREGRIAAGDRLPASRVFAAEIGVSRATVLTAFEQLAAEGYVESRRGAGVFVVDVREVAPEWTPKVKFAPAGQAASVKPKPLPLFYPGAPDMRLFPRALWGQYVGRVARADPAAMLELADSSGDWPLRRAIAEHLRDWRGIGVDPGQVVVTAGAGDALELVLRTIARPGARIGLEDPGYHILRDVCQAFGHHPHWLPLDSQGAILPADAVELTASVLTPSYQFPLGGTMSVVRRQAFLALAKQTSSWLIEDDFDSEYRYTGAPVPAMMSLPGGERVIYLGSFSKIFSAGLRIGYLVFPAGLVDRARAVLRDRGNRASAMPQRVLARFMEDGEFHRHVRKMRRTYRGRRQAFLSGVRQCFGKDITFDDHGAGMSVALRFTQQVDETEVTSAFASAGLHCRLLSGFYADPKAAKTGVLCGFCSFDETEISDGLNRMQAALDPLLKCG
ncbi:MAG: PLP-dependent aminotransferase family protein [Rhodobacteraceae bacterium]|nr:PLP-dependent aminotransferase family protein [Paracoccaceae bacterium]